MSAVRIFLCTSMLCVFINLSYSMTLQEYANTPFGNVLFLRHATAPGFGDPPTFQIGVCETQRNLDAQGRAQATAIGKALRNTDVTFADTIYSSQWCRCLETAQLLAMGTVQELPALNSFFQGLANKDTTLTALRRFLHQQPTQKSDNSVPIVVLVTHQVNITAITGITVSSGGAVAYDTRTGRAKEISIITGL